MGQIEQAEDARGIESGDHVKIFYALYGRLNEWKTQGFESRDYVESFYALYGRLND